MRIISELSLRRKLKAAYKKGLDIGYTAGYQARKLDEGKAVIMAGYDVDKDLEEILNRERF